MSIEGKKILKSATTALEGYTPVKTLSNNKLEKVVNASYKWIKTRKEIKGPPEMFDESKLTYHFDIKSTRISFIKKIIDAPSESMVPLSNKLSINIENCENKTIAISSRLIKDYENYLEKRKQACFCPFFCSSYWSNPHIT